MSSSSRCFLNPFQNSRPPQINEKYYKKRILECVEQIYRNLEPSPRNGEKGIPAGGIVRLVMENAITNRNKCFRMNLLSLIFC